MRRLRTILFFLIAGCIPAQAQQAVHVVISEVLVDGINESSAATNDEFIEIYNPTASAVDLSNWKLDYRSASGTSFTTKYTFPSGTMLPSHRYYLVGGGGVADRDNSSQTVLMGLGNSGGGVFLKNASGTTVDLLGWGSAVASNAEGTPVSAAPQGTSLERKADSASTSASMGVGGADEFDGNGFDSDNNASDFVTRTLPDPQNSLSAAEPALVNNGSGTGTAQLYPTTTNSGTTLDLTLSVVGDTSWTLDSIIVAVPSDWQWSKNLADVMLSGAGLAAATASVDSDSVKIGGCAVTATDSGVILLKSMTAPDVGKNSVFTVLTGSGGAAPFAIFTQPSIAVLHIVPIIALHANDVQGVPVDPYAAGTIVTVTGIVTADLNPSYTDVYVQDATAGIDVYSPNRPFTYAVGDSVSVTGTITQFRGLTEILLDSTLYVVHASGRPVPEPLLVTAADVNNTFNNDDYREPNEGRLVRINGVTYSSANSTVTDETGTTGGYIPASITAPAGRFDMIGILKQYKPGSPAPGPPYTGDYEVVPRSQDDILVHPGPAFVSAPRETLIAASSVGVTWTTQDPASGTVYFGVTGAYTDSVTTSAATDQVVTLSSLQSATVYHYRVAVTDTSGTNTTGDALFSTAAPDSSTGTILVYFNKSTDPSVAREDTARTVDLSQKFIDRIDSAHYSIDVALYSLSGTVGANIATALINAKNRGVSVRVIGEKDNQGTVPWSTLKNNGITVIDDGFDAANGGVGLMHNKFAVFDYRDRTSALDDWVWTGSWNATDPGTNNDAQNVIAFQDQSLAGAYTLEFDEMWGSGTSTPNAANSRFGIRKLDNTPHLFNIKGVPVELYFSPSDRTTYHIGKTLEQAQASIYIALLTFTRDDLAQILADKNAAGEAVRVVLDNNTDSGNEFSFLSSSGIDVHLKGAALTGLLHHKYALIDADQSEAHHVVITGSHNWSNSAENSNNENTVIVHDTRVASLYLQEFKARYLEAGGTAPILVSLDKQDQGRADGWSVSENYPNPFNPETTIRISLAERQTVRIVIFDVLGREVEELPGGLWGAGEHVVRWNALAYPAGIYFCRVEGEGLQAVRKLVLVK